MSLFFSTTTGQFLDPSFSMDDSSTAAGVATVTFAPTLATNSMSSSQRPRQDVAGSVRDLIDSELRKSLHFDRVSMSNSGVGGHSRKGLTDPNLNTMTAALVAAAAVKPRSLGLPLVVTAISDNGGNPADTPLGRTPSSITKVQSHVTPLVFYITILIF